MYASMRVDYFGGADASGYDEAMIRALPVAIAVLWLAAGFCATAETNATGDTPGLES
jgi:hypothetical protein